MGNPKKIELTVPVTSNGVEVTTLLEKEWLIPRKVRHFLRIRKNVWLHGEPVKFHQLVYSGDEMTLFFEEEDYTVPKILRGDRSKISILFEDEHLIVVNKAHGVKTHPNQPDETNTLINHLEDYLFEKGQHPYVVHRLDKETSGAIVFAKNPFILPIIGRMLEKKELQRIYQAKVFGIIEEDQWTINKKIGRDRHDRRKRIVEEKTGKPAITHVRVKKRLKERNETWITCKLDTGRTHQIRVHLASCGHPIVGDPLYQNSLRSSSYSADRLMLHSAELQFIHPLTKESIRLQAQPFLFTTDLFM